MPRTAHETSAWLLVAAALLACSGSETPGMMPSPTGNSNAGASGMAGNGVAQAGAGSSGASGQAGVPMAGAGTGGGGAPTGGAAGAGAGEAATPLADPAQLAARLARFLWADEAQSSEVAGSLGSASEVTASAEIMLTDDRARPGFRRFVTSWLALDQLATLNKIGTELGPELRTSMAAEAPAFAEHVVFDADARFQTLMTASYTFVDQTLAEHYGFAGITGATPTQIEYGVDQRVGILGGAGVLTRASSQGEPTWPARWYALVRSNLLCESPSPFQRPPGGQEFLPVDPGQGIRQQMIDITMTDPQCPICHETVNPIGFAFLKFDNVGRLRETDAAGPIDSSGTVQIGEEQLSFSGQPELMSALAARTDVRRCFARELLSHALSFRQTQGASSLTDDERWLPSLDAAHESFQASGGDIQALLVAITTTPLFLAP